MVVSSNALCKIHITNSMSGKKTITVIIAPKKTLREKKTKNKQITILIICKLSRDLLV